MTSSQSHCLVLIWTIAVLALAANGLLLGRHFMPKVFTKLNPNDDVGEPLFLTPLIQAGRIDEAVRQAQVVLPNAPDIFSYSGYLTVDKAHNSNMFFWFFPALNSHPEELPTALWLQGGPGGSSLFGLFVESGPLMVVKEGSDSYKAILRNYTWAWQVNMLYIDNPVGTGFSFTDSDAGYVTNEDQVADHLYKALTQFFTLFPALQKNPFYVTGESYAGKYVPAIGHKLHMMKNESKVPFAGVAIGDGLIDPETQYNYGDFLYQIGVIDSIQREHFHQEQEAVVALIKQKKLMDAFRRWDSLLNGDLIKVPSYFKNCTGLNFYFNFLHTEQPEDMEYYGPYVTSAPVRKAIHVGNLAYHTDNTVEEHLMGDMMNSTKPFLLDLLNAGYKVMLYSGQLDIIVATPLTDNMINTLKWSGAEQFEAAERKIWKVDPADREVAGYVKKAGNFHFVVIRGAGHIVPYDQPRAAYDMMMRYFNGFDF